MGLKAVQLSTGFNACWVCIVSPNTSFCSTLVFHNPPIFLFLFLFLFFLLLLFCVCVCVCTVYLLLFRVLCFVVVYLLWGFFVFVLCVCVYFFPFLSPQRGKSCVVVRGDKSGGWGVEEVLPHNFRQFYRKCVYVCESVCVGGGGGGVLYLSVLSVLTLLAVHIPLS